MSPKKTQRKSERKRRLKRKLRRRRDKLKLELRTKMLNSTQMLPSKRDKSNTVELPQLSRQRT